MPRRRLTAAGLVVLTAGVLAVGAAGAPATVPGPLLDRLGVARPTGRVDAPDFALPGLDGKGTRLRDLRGRPVLLYFWTTW